ncbi:MAG: trypsin-like serine protease [Chitinophagaceae bacterium]|nr:MAG: trypsin-like serine protease [Chitinophagaceae bacterium]
MKKIWAHIVGTVLTIGVLAINVEAAPLPDFSELIEKNSPAVVKITAVTKARQARMTRQLPHNQQQDIPEIFRELLEQRQMPPQDRGSMGSGFFISSDGYVLTNNHVVGDADEIRVIMSDHREFDAKLVGTDERSDIALLKVEAKNLPQLTLAANEKLKVGQWVLAIGYPLTLETTVTALRSVPWRSKPSMPISLVREESLSVKNDTYC